MLPGFFASSSLYQSSQVYAGYSTSPAGDITQLAEPWGVVTPANGRPPGSWCSADIHCSPGFTCCNTVTTGGVPYAECVDLQSNIDNCGSCLNMCRAGETCCGGKCIAQRDDSCGCPGRPCPSGHKCCDVVFEGFKCISVTGDSENCGSCGHRCSSGQRCCDGKCCSSPCCGGKCCSRLAKCVNGKCCYPEGDIAGVAALMCLLTIGSDCEAIYQQLQSEVCP